MTSIVPGTSLRIKDAVIKAHINQPVVFTALLNSNRLFSSWRATQNDNPILITVAENDPARLCAAAKSREKASRDGGKYPDLWIRARGAGNSRSPEARGLDMLPEEWTEGDTDPALLAEILRRQASMMNIYPYIFPPLPTFFELEDGHCCLAYSVYKAERLEDCMGRDNEDTREQLARVAHLLPVLKREIEGHHNLSPGHILIQRPVMIVLEPGYRQTDYNLPGNYPVLFSTCPRYYPLLRHSLDDRQALAVMIFQWLTGRHPFEERIWECSPAEEASAERAVTDIELKESRECFLSSIDFENMAGDWRALIMDLLTGMCSSDDAEGRLRACGSPSRVSHHLAPETPQSQTGAAEQPPTLAFNEVPAVQPATLAFNEVPAEQQPTLAFNEAVTEQPRTPALLPDREWQEGDVILDLYEVRRMLGKGGFGTVHLVHHRGWDMNLAVKSLNRDLALQESHKAAFIKECNGWIDLGLHPRIVSCHYAREVGGTLRIFAEYMEGGTLANAIDRGIRDWKTILDYALQCLEGLAYAHGKGLIHRDVKPANCLLTGKGELRITDFGIASGLGTLQRASISSEGLGMSHTLTLEGGAVGTPAYMPPEQWDPMYGETGPWSDLYAFGVMLYEMCCGERPFDEGGEDISVIKVRHLTAEPHSLRELRADMPEELESFILKCLAKKPQDRFQSCDEAWKTLSALYGTITSRPYGRRAVKEIDLRSDSLNNRAVSLLDLGRDEESLALWDEALSHDRHHLESAFNRCLIRWRQGLCDDRHILDDMESVIRESSRKWEAEYMRGLLHRERDDLVSAREAFTRAVELSGGNPAVQKALDELGEEYTGMVLKEFTVSPPILTQSFNGQPYPRSINLSSLDSFDGRYVAGCGNNGLWLIDAAQGSLFDLQRANVDLMALCCEGKKAFFGYREIAFVTEWDLAARKEVGSYSMPGGSFISQIAAAEDGTLAAFVAPRREMGQKGTILLEKDRAHLICCSEKKTYDLVGHQSEISAIAVSGLHQRAVTASIDGQIKLWHQNVCERTIEHGAPVTALAVTADGQLILSACDTWVKAWEICGGVPVFAARHCHRGGPVRITASTDGTRFFTRGGAGDVRIHRLQDGRVLRTLEGTRAGTPARDGLSFIEAVYTDWRTSTYAFTIRRIRREIGTVQAELHLSRVQGLEELQKERDAYSTLLARAEQQLAAPMYNEARTTLAQIRELPNYRSTRELFTLWIKLYSRSRKTGIITLWNLAAPLSHKGRVEALCIGGRGLHAATAGDDGMLRIWDMKSGSVIREWPGVGGKATSLSMNPDGTLLAAGHQEDCISIYRVADGKCLNKLVLDKGDSYSLVHFSGDGRLLLSYCRREIKLWNIEKGECLASFPHESEFQGMNRFLTADRLMRTAVCGSNELFVVDMLAGRIKGFLKAEEGISAFTATPDGRRALTGGDRGNFTLWDLATCQKIKSFKDECEQITALALSADGKWAAVSGASTVNKALPVLSIWELDSGTRVRHVANTREHHTDRATAIEFTPDGSHLVSTGWDGTVRFWAVEWELEMAEHNDLDERATACCKEFLELQTPLHIVRAQTVEERWRLFSRRGAPVWNDDDFDNLMFRLGCEGYGSLTPFTVKSFLKLQQSLDAALNPVKAEVKEEPAEAKSPVKALNANDIKALFDAAIAGDADRVRPFLERVTDIDMRGGGKEKRTMLHHAVIARSPALIKELVSRGADLDILDDTSQTPLHYAVENGSVESVELLLSLGADPVKCGVFNCQSAFHLAVEKGDMLVIKAFIARGVDIDAKRMGCYDTPVLMAASKGNKDLVDLLTTMGADVSKPHFSCRTPFSAAYNNKHLDIARMLYERGGKAHLDKFEQTIVKEIEKTLYPGLLDRITKKVPPVPRENVKDKDGNAPIHDAVHRGDLAALSALLAKGANPNIKSQSKLTALNRAVYNGRTDMVKKLLEYHASATERDEHGSSLLHLAASAGDIETAVVLLDAGLNVNARNDAGERPLHWAVKRGRKAMVALLLERGADPCARKLSDSAQHAPLGKLLSKKPAPGMTPRELITYHAYEQIDVKDPVAYAHDLLEIDKMLQNAEDRAAGKVRLT